MVKKDPSGTLMNQTNMGKKKEKKRDKEAISRNSLEEIKSNETFQK